MVRKEIMQSGNWV